MMDRKKTAAFLFTIAAASTMAIPVSAVQFIGGDMDGDDDADAADAALILQYAAYVGAGGTDSIYEYLTPAETPNEGEIEITESKVVIEEMSGKTLTEVIDAGYRFGGYGSDSASVIAHAYNSEYTDDTISSLIDSLNGKTVQEVVGEYGVCINSGYDGTYWFDSEFGSITISFDLAHGAEAIENHADEDFFPLETAEEIQSDVLENIALSGVDFYIEFDVASNEKLLAAEELDTDYMESISDELVVTNMYYRTLTATTSAETMPVSEGQFIGGDMDGDSDVDAADAALILQYAAYVGAGGTDSIYDFILSAGSTTENTEGTVVIEELSGKTLADVISAGYNFNYFWEYPDYNYVVGSADNDTYTDDTITAFVDSLTGKTVMEIRETYGIGIGGFGIGDHWIFNGYVRSALIRFDLEHGAEAAANLPDGASLAEAEEIQSDVLENIEFGGVRFYIKFDEASNEKLLAAEELTVEYIESIADELVVTSVYYRVG